MFFCSPEHLTFLRYEVLSPQRRYSRWDSMMESTMIINAYTKTENRHVRIFFQREYYLGFAKPFMTGSTKIEILDGHGNHVWQHMASDDVGEDWWQCEQDKWPFGQETLVKEGKLGLNSVMKS